MSDLLKPLLAKDALGWACLKCRFACLRIGEAVTHATNLHGAEAAVDRAGNVFDAKALQKLREVGAL